MRKGIWCAAGAYTLFGLFPLYWKALDAIPVLQTVCHRVLWSCVALLVLMTVSGRLRELAVSARSPRTLVIYSAAAIVVALNWFVYIWAVNAGFVVQTALGYFINPLVSVVLGVIVLGERLRPKQWAAVAFAACGVVYLAITYGQLPWIALALGFSFGTYTLLKKTAPLDALQGLTLETAILFAPALAFLIYEDHAGRGAFVHDGARMTTLMIGAGPVTALPLLLFAAGAVRIPLTIMGMLQYINPTLQFLIGVFVYHEPFSRYQFAGFGCVWIALILFAVEGYITHRSAPVQDVP